MSEICTLKLKSSCSVSPGKEANSCQQSNLRVKPWATWAPRASVARWHLLAASTHGEGPAAGSWARSSRQPPTLHKPPELASPSRPWWGWVCREQGVRQEQDGNVGWRI